MRVGVQEWGRFRVVAALCLTVTLAQGQREALSFNQEQTGLAEISARNPAASRGVTGLEETRLRAPATSGYGDLPLQFEQNRGQTDSRVHFLARGPGYTLFLTSRDAVFALVKALPAKPSGLPGALGPQTSAASVRRTALRLEWVGANRRAKASPEIPLPGTSNYLVGNDPAHWHSNLPNYRQVRYRNLYPGIDLVYYGNQRQLEHDLVIHPGADPTQVAFKVHGASELHTDAQGNLIMQSDAGELRLLPPRIYQEQDRGRHDVPGRYRLKGPREVAFELAAYDPTQPLVIDPVLLYSTYLGGNSTVSGMDTRGQAIAVDASGNAYVTGYTSSTGFPAVNAEQKFTAGGIDVFVAKLRADGSAMLYSTYLGGSNNDYGYGIAVDAAGSAYLTGYTASANFPVVNAGQNKFGGGTYDAFVAKLTPDGSGLLYSTFLGGSESDLGTGIAVNAAGEAFVTGQTCSSNFPITSNAVQTKFGGGNKWQGTNVDAFVAKLKADGSALQYSTYLGGSGADQGWAIALDSAGNAYIAGSTSSQDFPVTANSFQGKLGIEASVNAFVTKLSANGSALAYSTYLGGGAVDYGKGIAVDSQGNAYITGTTASANFPTTPNALQPAISSIGSWNAFATKLNADGTAALYSTYLGGTKSSDASFVGTWGQAIAVDSNANAYLAGFTNSPDFPTIDSFQKKFAGGTFDAFVAKLADDGSKLLYSSLLGGSSNDDLAYGVAVDNDGNVYVAGTTASGNFPVVDALIDKRQNTLHDAFVTKLGTKTSADFGLDLATPPVTRGSSSEVITYSGTLVAWNGYSYPVRIVCAAKDGALPETCEGSTVTPAPAGQPFNVKVANRRPGKFSFFVRGIGSDGLVRQQAVLLEITACESILPISPLGHQTMRNTGCGGARPPVVTK